MRNRLFVQILVSSALAAAIAGNVGCAESRPRSSFAERSNSPLNAAHIVTEFEQNEAVASNRYLGKRIRLAGYLARVDQSPEGVVTLTLKTSMKTFRPVKCVVTNPSALDRYSAGDPVTVSGDVGGFNDSVYYFSLSDCSVE